MVEDQQKELDWWREVKEMAAKEKWDEYWTAWTAEKSLDEEKEKGKKKKKNPITNDQTRVRPSTTVNNLENSPQPSNSNCVAVTQEQVPPRLKLVITEYGNFTQKYPHRYNICKYQWTPCGHLNTQ